MAQLSIFSFAALKKGKDEAFLNQIANLQIKKVDVAPNVGSIVIPDKAKM